jgi:hypothetical protein
MILYQILMGLIAPLVLLQAAFRGGAPAFWQRLGYGPPLAPGPALWIHGASIGELTSARWIMEALIEQRPGLRIFATSNSLSGAALVAGWGLEGVSAAIAPLDTFGSGPRTIDRVRPKALITLKNELWPARFAAAHRRRVPYADNRGAAFGALGGTVGAGAKAYRCAYGQGRLAGSARCGLGRAADQGWFARARARPDCGAQGAGGEGGDRAAKPAFRAAGWARASSARGLHA